MDRRYKWLLLIERLLLVAGGILLTIYASARVHSWISSNAALREFDRAHAVGEPETQPGTAQWQRDDEVDFSLWSDKRIRAFKETLWLKEDRALAVLQLDRLRIRVPVFEGTDELVLNRGVGWIGGTAKPGEVGNTGIAGHRDGFFRGLKDIAVGDQVDLVTLEKKMMYRVDKTEIVSPQDVDVLWPRGGFSLTLVTCYPFYFRGDAPQRFIVHATLQRQVETKISMGNKEKEE